MKNDLTYRLIRTGFGNETVQVDTYQKHHHLSEQTQFAEGFPLNPVMRKYFDNTPNEYREDAELADWWQVPFIQTYTWELYEQHDRETQSFHRQQQNEFVIPDEELERRIADRKASWLRSWPTGTRYDVRCLDGGAWDRSTSWGMAATLEAAIEICRTGPQWRRTMAKPEVLHSGCTDK